MPRILLPAGWVAARRASTIRQLVELRLRSSARGRRMTITHLWLCRAGMCGDIAGV
jgi:hypothetical protein